MKECWILSKSSFFFFSSMTMWSLFLRTFIQFASYITVSFTLICVLNPSLHLWNKSDLTMVNDLFAVFLNSCCIIRSFVLPSFQE